MGGVRPGGAPPLFRKGRKVFIASLCYTFLIKQKGGDSMQRILNLIETTLDAEVTPQELADHAGYSLWHFLHLFQQDV